ncbi:hypothetical protein MMC14_003448 [Varicellaria rhodocarpa]|nr:hypothetical protein [Varicellaria rhodocarpa]
MDGILSGLNEAQKVAVTSPASVLQILAPPGSGKTKTLTSRVAYLLSHHKYQPWDIICLTFTIKSAKEMKERITKLIGNGLEAKVILGTFHSVCRRYLVTYGHLIGIRKAFGIADSADSISIIKRIVKRLKMNIDPKVARSRISSSKARNIGCAELRLDTAKRKHVEQQEFVTVYEAYEAHLFDSNLLDYDDLLLRCVDLLRQNPACVSNVEAVLIDEFQDTNVVQFDLMRLFAAEKKRVTTVGDPDQSIYGWRSAEIKNLGRMRKQYPDTLVIHLEDNYRSSGAILLAALEVIQQDESRPPKPVSPTHCPGTIPVLRRIPSAAIEAAWIVSETKRIVGMTGNLFKFSDFAILLRSASLSRHIESAIGKAGIPYRMVGGQKFFDRVEVKIVLDYLRVINQPDNSDALSRILNVPSRRIGDVTIKALLEEADIKRATLWGLVHNAIQGNLATKTKMTKAVEQGIGSLINIIVTARKKILESEHPNSPTQTMEYVMKKLDFQGFLEKAYPEDHESRWANVEELLAQATDFSATSTESKSHDNNAGDDDLPHIDGVSRVQGNEAEEALSKFLANVALSTEIQRDDELATVDGPQERVTISTIHAAKGLEWPVVFIPSAYVGSIPHSRAEDTDEERRLLYVAMTRAQALLYMSCPTQNSMREETNLSHFLTSEKVTPYLTNKGPSMRASTIQDFCQILRRDYPSDDSLESGFKSVENTEDNLWPLNGEEDPEAKASEWNKHAVDGGNHNITYMNQQDDRCSYSAFTPFMTTTCTSASITMKNRPSYKTSVQAAGFVTANMHMLNVKQEHLSEQKRVRAEGEEMEGRDARGSKRKKPVVKGQGNLLQLWGPTNTGTTQMNSAAIPSSNNTSRPQTLSYDAHALVPSGKAVLPRTTIASTTTSFLLQTPTITPTAQKPIYNIPIPLANHTLRPLPINRPLVPPSFSTAIEMNHVPKCHRFLSSSPPPPADSTLHEEVKPPIPSAPYHIQCEKENASLRKSNVSDVRPVTTFHTTSMAQVQSRQVGSRRTLGVRRSMVGWSARGGGGSGLQSHRGNSS